MKNKIKIKSMIPKHWNEVSRIYKEGIETGFATFETKIPSWESWNSNHIKECRIVAILNDEIVGWTALSPVSSRCVYGGIGEVSVYVGKDYRNKNIGELLLQQLIIESEQNGLWTIQSGVFPENIGSIKLHEKLGFRKIGYREKIGKFNGAWKDNILLERRSKIIGIN